MTTPAILAHLEALPRARAMQSGGWKAACPGHADSSPSLSWTTGDDGKVVLHDFGGCTSEAVVAAMGMNMSDLFVPKANGSAGRARPRVIGTTEYGIRDADGVLVAEHVRLDYSDGAKSFPWRLPGAKDYGLKGLAVSSLPLYGSEHLPAERVESVVVTEGEKAADAVRAAGSLAAGTVTGAEHIPGPVALDVLRDRHVILWPDNDPIGRTHMERIAAALAGVAASVRWVDWPDAPPKGDAADVADAGTIARLVADALSTPSVNRATVQPPPLASTDRILEAVASTVARMGLAGESRAVKLTYLVVTTRLLDRIVSMAVKGPSSAGKSYLVEQVLRLFPDSAYHALSAMSEHALIYDDTDLVHRFLVIYEAAGLNGDITTYIVRSLLSEGRIRYTTVEKAKGGKLVGRTIDRPGPTGLLTTTTEIKLHPENETRLLSLTVSDSPGQTSAILLAHAKGAPDRVDLAPWHRLQDWLASGSRDVVVPYLVTLAQNIPPVAVRLRRDFPAVATLIRAHALLHRANRATDDHGAIVATFEDYAVVRELVADLVSDAAGRSVPRTVRETIAIVADLTAGGSVTTILAVAQKLGIDKSAASRRIGNAVDRGYVKNLEDKRGRPARLVIGDPLPEERTVLPERVELERLHGCSASRGDTHHNGIGDVTNHADRSGVADEKPVAEAVQNGADATVWPPGAPAWDEALAESATDDDAEPAGLWR